MLPIPCQLPSSCLRSCSSHAWTLLFACLHFSFYSFRHSWGFASLLSSLVTCTHLCWLLAWFLAFFVAHFLPICFLTFFLSWLQVFLPFSYFLTSFLRQVFAGCLLTFLPSYTLLGFMFLLACFLPLVVASILAITVLSILLTCCVHSFKLLASCSSFTCLLSCILACILAFHCLFLTIWFASICAI